MDSKKKPLAKPATPAPKKKRPRTARVASPQPGFPIVNDGTDRKRAEDTLRESELIFRTLIEEAPVAIIVSRNGISLYANHKFLEMVGEQSAEESVGRPIFEYFAPQFQEESKERTRRRSLGLPVPVEYESIGLRTNGSQFPIQVAVAGVELSDGMANIAFVSDITERKQAEEALRESEEKFRGLFENSHDALFVLEAPSWRFTSGNPASVKMFGAKNEEELISYTPWELSSDRQPDGRASAEKAREMIETAVREGFHFFEWTHRRIRGEEFPADVLLIRIEQEGNAVLQATVRDITARKQAEVKLHESEEKLRAIIETSPDAIGLFDINVNILMSTFKVALGS
jgi:PAS domain S-box-containing protein